MRSYKNDDDVVVVVGSDDDDDDTKKTKNGARSDSEWVGGDGNDGHRGRFETSRVPSDRGIVRRFGDVSDVERRPDNGGLHDARPSRTRNNIKIEL